MQKRTSFHQIATTLAALGATSLVAGDVTAALASGAVGAREVPHAVALGEGDTGDEDDDTGKDKDRGKDKGDDEGEAGNEKKKKGKKEGSCGGHGGCGAGKCG